MGCNNEKRTNIVFIIIAIISAVVMLSIFLYSDFVRTVDYKYQLMFGAGIISLISLNIYNYFEKQKIMVSLMCPLGIFIIAFIVSFM